MIKKIRILVIILFVQGLPFAGVANNDPENGDQSSGNEVVHSSPNLIFKVNPLPLLGFYSGLMIGIEHRVYKKLYLQYEGSTVSKSRQNWNYSNHINMKGLRGNLQLRYYYEQGATRNLFAGMESFVMSINYERHNTFGFDCEGFANCSYFKYTRFKEHALTRGLGITSGVQEVLWDRFFLEYSGSVGFNYTVFTNDGKPEQYDQEYGRISKNEGLLSIPYLSIAIRLGFVAHRKRIL